MEAEAVKFKERLLLWVLKRRIVAAYKKGSKMTLKPLPKWMNWVGNFGALAALVGSFTVDTLWLRRHAA